MPKIKRFDMLRKPVKEKWYLTPIAYALSFSTTLTGVKLTRLI